MCFSSDIWNEAEINFSKIFYYSKINKYLDKDRFLFKSKIILE